MKCPKCGYNSFDHLEECKKCGSELADHKGKFGLRGLLFPRRAYSSREGEVAVDGPEAVATSEKNVDFDFMDDTEAATGQEETSPEDLFGEGDTPGQEGIAEASLQKADAGIESAGTHGPFDAGPSGEIGEEGAAEGPNGGELDFDLDWEEDPAPLSDSWAKVGSPGEDLPDLDDWSLAEDGTEKKEWKKSAETPDRKEPNAPFEEGGDDVASVSPANGELSTAAAEEPHAPPGDDAPDFASLFLDSVEETPKAPCPSDPESLTEAFPPLDSGTDWAVLPGDLPPVSSEEDRIPVAAAGNSPTEEPSREIRPTEDLPAEFPAADSAPSGTEEEHAAPPPRPVLAARLGASFADLLALALLFALFLGAGKFALVPGDRAGLLPSSAMLSELAIPYFLVLFALCFGYFTLFHFLTGQTPGKMIFGLRVETEEGTDLLLSQAFLRSVGGLLSLLPAGLGYLRICFDSESRGWNDRLAGSRVVPAHGMVAEVASGD